MTAQGPRPKNDIIPGHASLEDFFYWINERHRIYVNRFLKKEPWPWTDDEILQEWRFTNVFRELDKGTLALRKMLEGVKDKEEIIFNTIWYRMFNWYEHAIDGPFKTIDELDTYLREKDKQEKQIFTNAHLHFGRRGERKIDTILICIRDLLKVGGVELILETIEETARLEDVFYELIDFSGIGKFIGYEMVSDLRWYFHFDDILEWANIGPGCQRGLIRLGLPDELDSLVELLEISPEYLEDHVKSCSKPFELREIEHSLCEFDKYQRVATGAGKPRQRYVSDLHSD